MEYKRFDDVIIIRVDPGEEITAQLALAAEREGVVLAEINGLGAVNDFTVGVYDAAARQFLPHRFQGAYEIASLHGTITGDGHLHLHMSAGGPGGEVRGGHLVRAVVSITAEIVMRVVNGRVERVPDAATGLTLLGL